MATPPNFIDLARQQRLATNSRLSFNSVVNGGSPASQNVAIPAATPTPVATVCVYNAGSNGANGTYIRTQSQDPDISILFTKGNYTLKYVLVDPLGVNSQSWWIQEMTEPLLLYYNTSQDANPPKTGWTQADGDDPMPDIGYYVCPTPTPTPTPTVTSTPTPTPTPTPLPSGYQTPPYNFTTYVNISGRGLGQTVAQYIIYQFSVDGSGNHSVVYKQGGQSYANSMRFIMISAGAGRWSLNDYDNFFCGYKMVYNALTGVTVTKNTSDADGWINAAGDCSINTTTLFISAYN
jgi:hypothetical protein